MLRRTLSVQPKVMLSSSKSNISKEDIDDKKVDVDIEPEKKEESNLVSNPPVKKKIRFGKSSEKEETSEDENILGIEKQNSIEPEKKEVKNDYARPSFKGSSWSDSSKSNYYKNSLSKKISNIASRDIEEYEW